MNNSCWALAGARSTPTMTAPSLPWAWALGGGVGVRDTVSLGTAQHLSKGPSVTEERWDSGEIHLFPVCFISCLCCLFQGFIGFPCGVRANPGATCSPL